MSHNMHLAVVAEGIEISSQFEFLQRYDCEYGQGYYFSKPLEASDIPLFINNNQDGLLTNT